MPLCLLVLSFRDRWVRAEMPDIRLQLGRVEAALLTMAAIMPVNPCSSDCRSGAPSFTPFSSKGVGDLRGRSLDLLTFSGSSFGVFAQLFLGWRLRRLAAWCLKG